MSSYSRDSWRVIFKNYLASARVSIFRQVLQDELDMDVDSNSKILMSNTDTAVELLKLFAQSNDEEASLPVVIIAQELTEANYQHDNDDERRQKAISVLSVDQLRKHKLTHAFLHIHTDKSERDILDLLRLVFQRLDPNGKLILSRRKRDGFAEILHDAGVQVPGRQQRSDVSSPSNEDDVLTSLVAEAGFLRNKISSIEKSHLVMEGPSDTFVLDVKRALEPTLGPCDEGAGWKAMFDDAATREIAEHGGVLLVANVVMATKAVA